MGGQPRHVPLVAEGIIATLRTGCAQMVQAADFSRRYTLYPNAVGGGAKPERSSGVRACAPR